MSKSVKKILVTAIVLLVIFEFNYADILYYKNDFKITNCKILSIDEGKYKIETITKTGPAIMILPDYIVDVVVSQNVDSAMISEILPKTTNDEKIAKYLREIKNKEEKNIAIEEKNRNKLEEIEKRERIKIAKIKNNQKIDGDYYLKSNVPLLSTGIALTTHGLVNLVSTAKIEKQIEELEAIVPIQNTAIDELRSNLTKAYIYGAIFTVAGVINIYCSFEKVSIGIISNQLTLSYDF